MRATVLVATMVLAVGAMACTSTVDPTTTPSPVPTDGTAAPRASATSSAPAPVDAPPGVVRLQGCEPRSLLPSDVAGRCGQQVVTGLFSPLVELDPVDGTPRWGEAEDDAVASGITSLDARRWVIELEEGWEFHDGTPVTAASFVDAWNFAAYGPNGQANAFLFAPIVGFDALHCPDPGCEPTGTALQGLRALDETTLEVVLASPDRDFPRRLGHVAFSPLPPSALEDPEAFEEAPVGNGPFRMEGAWAHQERISLRAVEEHPSGRPAVDGVDVVLFDDLELAWQAMAEGRLDITSALPSSHREEARARFTRVVRDGDDYEALVVPTHLRHLSEDDRVGRALSMAIDRRRLIEAHLAGAARPARGLVPPVVSDEVDRCGALCRFDPEAARALLAEAGGLPPAGIELWFDADGERGPWVRAIAGQWRQHLGLAPEQVRVRSLAHTSWVAHLQDQRTRGLYPTGWSMDVASSGEYFRELHGPGGLFNFDRYAGADVAARLAEAARATSDRETRLAYRRLEQALLADLHHIPLWTRTHEVLHTPRVTEVAMDGKGNVRLAELAVEDDEG